MRVILTHHARSRLLKRLIKKKNPPITEIYERLRDFLKNTRTIEVLHGRGKNILFTDGEDTLVCTVLKNIEVASKEEILERVKSFPFYRIEAHILDYVNENVKKEVIRYLESIPSGRYYFYFNVEKDILYVGFEEPLLAITFRPAKSWERTEAVSWAISIYKEFADLIFRGEKKWELRKTVPRDLRPNDVLYVYVPRPVRAYVGYFKVGSIIRDTPEKLWERIGAEAGIEKELFDQYFNGYEVGIAIEVREPELFEKPIDLDTLRVYLPNEHNAIITPQNITRLDKNIANIINYLASNTPNYTLRDYEKLNL